MTTNGGALTFGDPRIDLAVETAIQAYGDDREAVFAGVCTRDKRCLTMAASALADAGIMGLGEAARLLGLSAKSVKVTRCRKSIAFRLVEEVVIDVLNGETRDVEAVARAVASNQAAAAKAAGASRRWAQPGARAAMQSPEIKARREAARQAAMLDPAKAANVADAARRNLVKAQEAKRAKREAGVPAPPRPRAARPAGNVAASRRAPHVERKLPYVRRFLGAGWKVAEVAYLFDISWTTVDRVRQHG